MVEKIFKENLFRDCDITTHTMIVAIRVTVKSSSLTQLTYRTANEADIIKVLIHPNSEQDEDIPVEVGVVR